MKETIFGLIRHVLTAGGGFLVSKGWIDAGQVEIIAGSVVALIGVAWSVIAKKKAV